MISKTYRVTDPNSNFDDIEVKASSCRTFIVVEVDNDELFIEPDLLDEFIEVLHKVKLETL